MNIFSRLREASSHAGIASIAQVAKMFLPPPWGAVLDAVTVLCGALAVAIPEAKPTP